MHDRLDEYADPALNPGDGGWLVFALGGERLALPMQAVEAVVAPPALALVPHAPPVLLGAGSLGGEIVPVLDLARLLGRRRVTAAYDGSGEVMRLRTPAGRLGLWVDRVERTVQLDPETGTERRGPGAAGADRGAIAVLDPALLFAGIEPPAFGTASAAPLGDVSDTVQRAADGLADTFVLVEIGGQPFQLGREAVLELVETVAWTRIPRAPAGLLGVAVLRGVGLPVLSLAPLLGLAEPDAAGGFAVVAVDRRRLLLAVDRVVGLRFRGRTVAPRDAALPADEGETGTPLDVAAALSDELRRIVLGFTQAADAAPEPAAGAERAAGYLVFTVAGQEFGVAVDCVDRVVGAQPLLKLPPGRLPAGEPGGRPPAIAGAIELRGQVMPVAALEARFDAAAANGSAQRNAYVILRGSEGPGAIAVDQVEQLVALRPQDIVAPPSEHGPLSGVAARADGRLLRIIAPERLWEGM